MPDLHTRVDLAPDFGADVVPEGLSAMARGMVSSSILTIAWEIRALRQRGVPVADMTVGDFSPREFPIPERLRDLVVEELRAGATNYPPPAGEPDLRAAVREHVRRTQGMDWPEDGITIVSGGRPALYSAYRLLTDPGDAVLYPAPSWNNHNYAQIQGLRPIVVPTSPADAFQPTVDLLRPHLAEARLLVLNTPQNPSGGVMPRDEVEAFGRMLVEENHRRLAAGEKPLFLLYDQIYRSLVFSGHVHYSPVELVPECAPWVVHTDGISKGFCATGLRCGWMFAAPAVARKAAALLTHVGAWAPKPVQRATARWLDDAAAVDAWTEDVVARVRERLDPLHAGLLALRDEGLPVDCIAPQGAIYLSVRFAIEGWRTADGTELRGSESVRRWLLENAAFAVVPFSAFGVPAELEHGWVRVSVGAVSVAEVEAALPRLRAALLTLRPPAA